MSTPRHPSRPFIAGLRAWAIALLLIVTSAADAAEVAGAVVLTKGVVSAQGTDGQVRLLGKDSQLFEGDRITTAAKSLAVLEMIDGAKMTVREESEIVIEEYVYKGDADDRSLLELVKGGFRALTGLIGTNNPEAYEVRSPLSVLGIRGTRYLTRLCGPGNVTDLTGEERRVPNVCAIEQLQLGGDREGAPEGQYTIVDDGTVFMRKGAVELDLVPGQVGFADREQLVRLPTPPGFISNDPTVEPAEAGAQTPPLAGLECRV